MILVGHPFQMRIVPEVQGDHLLNCENNNDYTVIDTEAQKFYNPITKVWEPLDDRREEEAPDGKPTG